MDAPATSSATRRWWPIGAAIVVVCVVVWSFATAWGALWASHPAGWLALLLAAAASAALIVWALHSTPRDRSVAFVAAARTALVIGGALIAIGLWWVRPLPADRVAIDTIEATTAGVSVDDDPTRLRLLPDSPSGAGFVFYPGAKVDPRAYSRLLMPLAEAGHTIVVVKAPFNLGILAIGAAGDDVGDSGDAVTAWAVGGHSLGGVAAASFAGSRRDELAGLVFWASFPANDLSDRNDLRVLSVSGSEDGLSTPDDIEASRADLPATAEFVEVQGATHAFFGDYGTQSGDGTATVPRRQAQSEIISATLSMLDSLAAG